MSTSPKTLEQLLNDRADRSFDDLLGKMTHDLYNPHMKFGLAALACCEMTDKKERTWYGVASVVRNLIEGTYREAYREKFRAEFVAKVEAMQDQMESYIGELTAQQNPPEQ